MEKKSLTSINSKIDFGASEGLNVEEGSLKGVFIEGDKICSPDGDPEILIRLVFKEKVSISAISVNVEGKSDFQPSSLKMFADNIDLDFSDVADSDPSEEFNPSLASSSVALKMARFRMIDSLTVFS